MGSTSVGGGGNRAEGQQSRMIGATPGMGWTTVGPKHPGAGPHGKAMASMMHGPACCDKTKSTSTISYDSSLFAI